MALGCGRVPFFVMGLKNGGIFATINCTNNVFIPKPEYGLSYPAMVIELKWNKSAETALRQIKAKKYPDSIRDYTGSILLVGINYDEKTKAHECSNEKCDKE